MMASSGWLSAGSGPQKACGRWKSLESSAWKRASRRRSVARPMGSGLAKAQSHWRLSVGLATGPRAGFVGVLGPSVSGLVICARIPVAAVRSSVKAASWRVRRIRELDGVKCLLLVDGLGEGAVNEAAHLVGGDVCRGVAARDVGGAVAGGEDLVDGGFDGERVLFEPGGVTKEHRGGEDRAEWIGLALAGDVGCGAVDGLVEVDLAAERGGGQHAERAGDDAGLVGEDVAEEVFGEHDVEVARYVHEVHRHRVDELVLDGYVGVFGFQFVDGGAPELRALEYVGLVDLSQFLATLARELEGDAPDADDLVLGVAHRVDGLAGLHIPRARLAEVEAAKELAHEEDVDTLGDLGAQWRVVTERGEGKAGAQVCIATEDLADLQQAGFGALVGREVVELVV